MQISLNLTRKLSLKCLMAAIFLAAWYPLMAQQPPATTPQVEATNDATATNQPAQSTNDVAATAKAEQPTEPEPEHDDGNNRHNDNPVVFANFVLDAGVTNHGDKPVIKGSTKIDGVLEGDSVTVAGNAIINGTVTGDLVVVLGSCQLGPTANISGDVVVAGGTLTRATGAKIGGQIVEVDFEKTPALRGAVPWITQGLLLGRPLPFGVAWAWMVAGLFLVINLILLAIFPGPLQACVETVERQPLGSLFAGILVKLLAGLVIVILLISVIGIIAVPFVIAGLVVSFLFGKITIYRFLGQQIGKQAHLGFLQTPVVALVLGTAIFYLLYAVPFLGFVAWAFTGIFGMGAVAMTIIHKYREERAKAQPPKPAATPVPPPSDAGLGGTPAPATAGPDLAASAFPAGESAMPVLTEPTTWPRVGFWLRLCSALLDLILISIPLAMLHIPIDRGGPGPFMLLWLGYNIMLWFWKGTTVGGIITGIKVVRTNGQPLQFVVALIRGLASLLSFAAAGLGFIWAGIGPEKRAWHDKIAGTIVVRAPHGVSLI
jgi:uncharacterized RDD family membrane protein YckC